MNLGLPRKQLVSVDRMVVFPARLRLDHEGESALSRLTRSARLTIPPAPRAELVRQGPAERV
jgi:hypothetical protein